MISIVAATWWVLNQPGALDAIINFFPDFSNSNAGIGSSSSSGTLLVSSNGGDVYVAGQYIGRGGGSITLAPGTYSVTCYSASAGKITWQTSVQVFAGKTSQINNNTDSR